MLKNEINKKSVSIIIPAYNEENYIEKCLMSVLNQSYEVDEIIIVDDGSTDGTRIICESYESKFDCIRVIHKENTGLFDTRKYGMRFAKNEYVMFVDADDCIEEDLLEKLCMSIEDAEVAIGGLTFIDDKGSNPQPPLMDAGIYTKKSFYDKFIDSFIFDSKKKRFNIMPSYCSKLFKRDFLIKGLLATENNLVLGEDGAVVFPLIASADKIAITKCCGYFYRQNQGSMMRNLSVDSFGQIALFEQTIRKAFNKIGILEIVENQIKAYVRIFLKITIKDIFDIDFSDFKINISRQFDGKRVLIYGAGKLGKIFLNQLLDGDCILLGCIDTERFGEKILGMKVKSPESIKELDFDYIIVAVSDNTSRHEIISLLLDMGIDEEKIVWYPVLWG